MKTFPSRTFRDPLISKGHHHVSPPKFTNFGTLSKPKTSGDIGTPKRVSKVPLGERSDSPEFDIITGAAPVGLHIGQLKMDMSPVFIASKQYNVRG